MKKSLTGWLACLLLAGCSSLPTAGDRSYRAGDYIAAASAYERDLENRRLTGRRRERALFHLGMIHVRPNSELYDPQAARRHLEELTTLAPTSPYAHQATVVLALQLEVNRLRDAMVDQTGLSRLLLDELQRLRSEAERIETRATDERERAHELAARIGELRGQMETLASELAAREEELERLKRIDLEDPP